MSANDRAATVRDDDQAAYLEAKRTIEQGRVGDGIAQLVAQARGGSTCLSVYEELSRFAEARGDIASALVLLDEVINRSSSLARSLRRATLLQRSGAIDSSLDLLGSLICKHPDNPDVLEYIRRVLERCASIPPDAWARLVNGLRRHSDRVTAETQIRLVFVAQHVTAWPSMRSVWRYASRDPRFDAVVVLAPFFHPLAAEAETAEQLKRCLLEEGVPFCASERFNCEEHRPHVVFLQNPYEDTRPEHLRSPALNAAGTRIAYIPYGLEVGGGAWNLTAQFDGPLQRTAWRIFARSEHHKALFGKHCQAGNQHVVVTGHPKFDAVTPMCASGEMPSWSRKIGGRKLVLWTPHFSEGAWATPAWSTFRLYGEHILSLASQWQELFFLVRPHPMFFKAMLKNQVWGERDEEAFRAHLAETSNLGLDESPDYHAGFECSSALMADVGSFLLEYLPSGKPILYLNDPRGFGMNDDGALAQMLYRADSREDIDRFIAMIGRGDDPRREERIEALPRFLYGLDGKVGQRICEYIRSELIRETGT